MEEPTSHIYVSKKDKTKKPYRTWTVQEELELIAGLKEAVLAGYRTENGWKPGHYLFLQKHLHTKLPGTDLMASPHIESKLKVWRRDHGCIMTLLDRSGVGWDAEKKIIECSDEIWTQHTLNYPSFAKKRNQPWPYYDEWCEVFGKDRATGKMTRDFQTAIAAKKILAETLYSGNDNDQNFEEVAGNDNDVQYSQGLNEEFSTTSSKRQKCNPKQSSGLLEESISAAITKVVDSLNANCGATTKFEDNSISQMRKNLVPLLKQNCKTLTLHQILKVGIKIANDVSLMEVFYSLAEEDREEFAIINLEGSSDHPSSFFNL